MTDEERYEIVVLAEALEIASRRCEMLGYLNTPTDPDDRMRSAIAYRLAQTEYLEARFALDRAQQRIASK